MRVAGLAIGGLETLLYRGKTVKTGLFKRPVEGPLTLGEEGVEGDLQADRRHHGGRDKAVYLYSLENLVYFATLRGDAPYPPGYFGENLTLEGLDDHTVHLGDQFEIGSTLIEVTQPRVPCFKLGLRMKDPRFVGTFMKSGRTGFYARILREGQVHLGDPVRCVRTDPLKVSIPVAMQALLKGPKHREVLQKVLAVPALSKAWRDDLLSRLNDSNDGDPHDA